jgi:hypothetical protein
MRNVLYRGRSRVAPVGEQVRECSSDLVDRRLGAVHALDLFRLFRDFVALAQFARLRALNRING